MRINNRSLFKPKARGYKIENKTNESTIYLYDEISYFGVSAEQFNKDFNAIKSSTIHIRINSPGGSVFDGTAIYNAIKQHKSHTIGHIDGLAASIASVIALAADEVRMAENAFLMIHEPFSIVIGTAQDMRDEADLLSKVAGTIAKTYANKTGKEEAEIKDIMAAETWMTAQEAIDNGFIDKIEETKDEKSDKSQSIMFDLSAYANVPDALKDRKEAHSARDIEHILRDAGVSVKQSKAILSEGFKEELRDVATPAVEDLRDVGTKTDEAKPKIDALRDVEPQSKKKDKVDDLLIRAELIAPSKRENNACRNNYEYLLQMN